MFRPNCFRPGETAVIQQQMNAFFVGLPGDGPSFVGSFRTARQEQSE
jgi:hypothetical protein